MDLTLINDDGEDYATLEVRLGRDDNFRVHGYGSPGEVRIELPLYVQEARELIDVLQPLADREED